MMSIRRVKTISAIIIVVLVQCTLIKSHSAARGSIQINTATSDTNGRAGELSYSGRYYGSGSGSGSGPGSDKVVYEWRHGSDRDVTCKAGEGIFGGYPINLRTSGAQCSGIYKITTEEECKAAAIYTGTRYEPNFASDKKRVSGCHYHFHPEDRYKVYVWNPFLKSTIPCSDDVKCVCKTKICTKCPPNTYSEGGTSSTCRPCPKDRPYTFFYSKQDSIESCSSINNACAGGYIVGRVDPIPVRSSGKCKHLIETEEECKTTATYNINMDSDKNKRYIRKWSSNDHPYGCIRDTKGDYKFNRNDKSTHDCRSGHHPYDCICKTISCTKCPPNTHSKAGKNTKCTPCPEDRPYTFLNKQDSENSCTSKKDAFKCKAGEEVSNFYTGDCKETMTSDECREWANKENLIYQGQTIFKNMYPQGCFQEGNKIWFNDHLKLTNNCGTKVDGANMVNCICKTKACTKCPINTFNSKGGIDPTCTPCSKETPTTNFQTGQSKCMSVPTIKCNAGHEVTGDAITKKKECKPCDINHYNDNNNGTDVKCKPCEEKKVTLGTGQSTCIREFSEEYVMWKLENIDKIMAAEKEKTNDLSIKNSRLWQKEQIRLQHDKMMAERKARDNQKEKSACEDERKDGTIIFPAMEISNEIEDKEDTTCIDTNRDELLKSFCSFRMDLDNLFQIQSIDKEAKSFWPNICCKERRDTTLEVCEDPKNEIKRENIIPFALSQGGNYSRHNLYVEVTDTIKHEGYLHTGMKKLLDSLKSIHYSKTQNAKHLVDLFFNDVSLCGPRIVDAPGAKDKKKLCELFIPYQHSMTQFYNLIESLYTQPMPIQTSSFLETMERSLRKRSAVKRIGKNNMQQVMQMKPAPKALDVKCTGGSKWVSSELKKRKKLFCLGYNHLDLSNTNIRNVAVHYLKNDIDYNNTEMFRLSKQLRYQVIDASCPAPLFTANDISIQQVAMDTLGKEKEWVAVVNLNTEDKNGYLQSELPHCEARDYLIGAKVTVKVFEDNKGCCPGLKDFKKCEQLVVRDSCKSFDSEGQCEEYNTRQKCGDNLPKLVQDKHHKHYSKGVVLTGTQYTVKSSHVSRRRLLQNQNGGC